MVKSSGQIQWSNPVVISSDQVQRSNPVVKSSSQIQWSNPAVKSGGRPRGVESDWRVWRADGSGRRCRGAERAFRATGMLPSRARTRAHTRDTGARARRHRACWTASTASSTGPRPSWAFSRQPLAPRPRPAPSHPAHPAVPYSSSPPLPPPRPRTGSLRKPRLFECCDLKRGLSSPVLSPHHRREGGGRRARKGDAAGAGAVGSRGDGKRGKYAGRGKEKRSQGVRGGEGGENVESSGREGRGGEKGVGWGGGQSPSPDVRGRAYAGRDPSQKRAPAQAPQGFVRRGEGWAEKEGGVWGRERGRGGGRMREESEKRE